MNGGAGVPLFLRLGLCLFNLQGSDFSVVIKEVSHDVQEGEGGEICDWFAEGVEEVGWKDAGNFFRIAFLTSV